MTEQSTETPCDGIDYSIIGTPSTESVGQIFATNGSSHCFIQAASRRQGRMAFLGETICNDHRVEKFFGSNIFGEEYLIDAATQGNIVGVHLLISCGVIVGYRDHEALYQATLNNHPKIVELILLHGGDPSVRSYAPLLESIKMGAHKSVDAILCYWDKFYDIFEKCMFMGTTHNFPKIIKLLVQYRNKFYENDQIVPTNKFTAVCDECLVIAAWDKPEIFNFLHSYGDQNSPTFQKAMNSYQEYRATSRFDEFISMNLFR